MVMVPTRRKLLRIKAERLRRNWSQTDLAYFARMSASDVSRIETGRQIPYPGHAERLGRILGLDPTKLVEKVEV